MTQSLTDILCTKCGLCCDGSLFADVELASTNEADGLQILGLDVEDDDAHGVLLLPCGALRGTRCSIYAHRPATCRSFECRLLQDVRAGAVSVSDAQEAIAEARRRIGRVRSLLARSGCAGERRPLRLPLRERCAEVLSLAPGASPAAQRRQSELESAMAAVERIIAETFLREGR